MARNGISGLASLLRENGDKVLNGHSKLCLTVALLRSLNEGFSIIVDNDEGCSNSFHVINTNSTDAEIFKDIQFLHDFVQKVVGLKVSNGTVTDDCDKDTLDICKFRNLKYLELRKVPLHLLHGIQSVRAQLQSVVCIRCIQRLEDLLLDCGADHSSGFVWSDLREAVFSYNGLDLLDHSLEFAPWLQILDLSHNRISQAAAVECLPNLKYLNMSYNLLDSVPVINKDACRKLQVLVIKNNYIEDLSGLVALESLLELDLSCNCLSEHSGLIPLLQLSALNWLSLEGNPLSFHPQHRTRTACHLHESTATSKFMLDRMPLSKSERFSVGTLGGIAFSRTLCKEDTSSAGSCSASERSSIAERGGQSATKPHHGRGFKRSGRVREAVISEQDGGSAESVLSSSFMTNSLDLSTEHLETKKQIETLRERFGEENWLHSHAGSCVQDLLGLHNPVTVSSPTLLTAASNEKTSPLPQNVGTVTDVHVNRAISDGVDVAYTLEVAKDAAVRDKLAASDTESAGVRVDDDDIKESSPESVEVQQSEDEEGEEEDEGEGEEQLYLVQRQRSGNQITDEFFLVVTEKHLKERDILCGKTHERWTVASLLSCIRIGGESPAATVQLTFDTVRRDRQERVYIMDEKDAQKLVQALGEVVNARPLAALNQLLFRCMKCSTQFSQKQPPTGVAEDGLTCPSCNSTIVIEMDEVTLPSHCRIDRGEKQSFAIDDGPLPLCVNSSPSQSSIGRAVSDTGASTVVCGGDRLQVTAMVHHSEVQQQPSRSAASLDAFASSPHNIRIPVKRWDSDIEIISNPSQSSIEVLDEQARLQGTVTPARLQSSEEKQMVSVAVPPRRPVVPEVSTHLISVTGLTESSSSSSLTDSICTTYEIHSVSLSLRQGSTTEKSEGTENVIIFDDGSNHTDTSVSQGIDEGAEKLSRGLLDECDHEDGSPSLLFRMHEEKLSPQMNYASMLKDLLQSVGSKLPSKPSEKVLESSSSSETATRNDRVKYSYTDFSVVDHRVKLYLYLHVFQHEEEELLFLLRAQIIPQSSSVSYPGCLVMSSRKVYVLQITGEEGDDPEQWLHTVESSPVEMLMLLFPLLWQQGIGMGLLREGEQLAYFLFILQDQDHTINFFSFLTGMALPEHCRVEHEMIQKQAMSVQQLLLSAAARDATDPTICMCAVSYSCRIQRKEDKNEVDMGAIVVTATDLLLMMDNLQWLLPKPVAAPQKYCAQKIINLIEVEMEDHCKLTLHFLDEAAGSDESWSLKLGTDSTVKAVVSAIRIPWEQLFSVPLQVLNKSI